MESRPWIARPTIHQNRPQNSIVLSERISLISILTKILTPVYLENIWFLDKTWIQTTEISVKSKRETPLAPKIRDAFPHLWSGLSWVLSVTTCCWCVGTLPAPAARYPANADPTIEQRRRGNWFSTALYTNTNDSFGQNRRQTNWKLRNQVWVFPWICFCVANYTWRRRKRMFILLYGCYRYRGWGGARQTSGFTKISGIIAFSKNDKSSAKRNVPFQSLIVSHEMKHV